MQVLHTLLNFGFLEITSWNSGTRLLCILAVQLQQFLNIKFRRLEDLDFADIHLSSAQSMGRRYILKGIDGVAALLDFPSNNLWNQFLDKVLQCSTGSLLAHDIHHSLANLTDLSGLSISRLLDLIWSTLGECNDKDTQEVSVGGLDIGVSFNEGLPLANEGFEFVAGERHSGEVG